MALTDRPSVHDAAIVHALLAPGGVTAAFQPIIELATGRIAAWEALGRVPGGDPLRPDHALAMAERVGRAADLEVAYWDAVAEAGPPPGGALLFVNIGTSGLSDPRMFERLAALPSYVVVEITERVATSDEDGALSQAVRWWSSLGVRFAVDDAGAGYSSLRRVIDLEPGYVKLDASLVQGVATDDRLQAAVTAMTSFAGAIGAQVVAEGVENSADLEALAASGVDLAQGFLLGRPGPPWTLPGDDVIDLSEGRP